MHVAPPSLDALTPLITPRVILPKHKDYKLKQDGIFTVVERVTPLKYNNAVYAMCWRWAKAYNKWLPLLARFMKLVVTPHPIRFLVFILGRMMTSVMDMASLWSDTKLETLVETAVSRRILSQSSLIAYALSNIFSNGLRVKLEGLFTHNEGVLSSDFDLVVKEQIIRARSKLDITTLTDPIVSSFFAQANAIQALGIATHVVLLLTQSFNLWGQIKLFKNLSKARRTSRNLPLLAFAFSSCFLSYFRWFIVPPSSERSKASNNSFHRLTELWQLSCQSELPSSSAELKLLNLDNYLINQFNLARSQLRGLAFIRNRGKTWLSALLDLQSHAWPILLRSAFAVQAIRNPSKLGTISQLSITMMCTRKIMATFSALVSTIDDIRLDCSKIKSFYQVLDIQPQIKDQEQPARYHKRAGPLGEGMKIEFRDVSFGYSGENGPMALKNLSFTIQAGAMVCVVGGNGAGKSTLIKLLTRLYEPTSGEILINDRPIQEYSQADLHTQMAVQFQHCPVSKLTIAEFVGLGGASQNPDKSIDVAALKEALERADAMGFINTLDRGIWSRLGPFPPRASPQSILSEAVYYDNQLEDEWCEEEERLEPMQTGASKVNSNKRNTTYSLNFSGGEWAKIAFARTLMKKDADLRIFDEPAAALDPIAANTIFRNIDALRGRQTICHITHQLRSAMGADLILCLKNGQLVEQGAHHELIAKPDGFYYSLAAIQLPELFTSTCSSTAVSTPMTSGSSAMSTPALSTPSDSECGANDSGFFDFKQ